VTRGDWATFLAETAAVTTALASGAAVGARWLRRALAARAQREQLLSIQLPDLITQMRRVHAELVPNGGGSIKDAILRIEQRQLLSERRTWALLADAPTAIFEAGVDGRVRSVNQTFARWAGRDRDDLVGHGWLAAIASADRDRVSHAWRTAVREQREFRESYRLQPDDDGPLIPVVCATHVVRGEREELLGFIGTLTKRAA
jgi:PAS domain S-box-containing protein